MGINTEKNYRLELIDLSTDDTVNSSGASDTILLQPDKGFIYEVKFIIFQAWTPAGSSSGTHVLYIYPANVISTPALSATIQGNFGTTIRIGQNSAFTGDTEQPSGSASQLELITKGVYVASNTYPVAFKYVNNTDANQTGTRTLKILVKKYREAL